jgi:glycosyltransferase involved in cell wall biosynthesis
MMNVLCVSDYFLPGFKGGGPITTLANMRKQIASEIVLSIFTRDRDIGASEPYPHIETNCWMETPDGAVFYATPDAFGPSGLRMALEKRPAHLLYLNSFFSPRSSILPQLLRPWIAPDLPILIAPRGEFSAGALSVKAAKKRVFIWFARMFGLYKAVHWHASTDLESCDILRQFPGSELRIHIAPDPVVADSLREFPSGIGKQANKLNAIFISRISPIKNLDMLLELLSDVQAIVNLDIFGPIEDKDYWQKCETIVSTLPDNIEVQYRGPIAPDEISNTFARYDLFIFPTQGENFGHVIFEALRAGTPVLLSDRTPWHPDDAGAVKTLSLDKVDSWRMAIEHAAVRTPQEQENLRLAAHDYASRYLDGDTSLMANLRMFQSFTILSKM